MFKIATWNVNSLRVRLPHVLDWLCSAQPDVLALQETKLPDERFPAAEIREAGYDATFWGQKAYNGVAILSRGPVADVVRGLPGIDDNQCRVLAATARGVRVLDVYVPNGENLVSEKYMYKLDWLEKLVAYVRRELDSHQRLVVAGDFNIAPEDRDVHDPEALRGQVLVSDLERASFRELLGLGLADAFRLFEQPQASYSWWDYQMGAFRRNRGMRLDHILAAAALARTCTSCHIDREPRARKQPSDHTPVVAEFATE